MCARSLSIQVDTKLVSTPRKNEFYQLENEPVSRIQQLTYRARYNVTTVISTRPGLYYPIRRLTGTLDNLCVQSDFDIVLEGFPRSANSTTVHGFVDRQRSPVRVAHHKHHAAQLLQGSKLGLPCAVLIRDPVSVVLSNLALREVSLRRHGKENSGQRPTFGDTFRAYTSFYRAVLPKIQNMVIAPFEEVTVDITQMIERINAQFGTAFDSAPNQDGPAKTLGDHARPSDERDQIKENLIARYTESMAQSGGLRKLEATARKLHEDILIEHDRRR